MSHAVTRWAKRQSAGGIGPKAVLLALADMADDAGVAWPSQARLAQDLECDERTIRRSLATLQERGLISRELRRRDDGLRRTDLIRLSIDQPDNLAGSREPGPASTGQSDRSDRTICPQQPDKKSPLTSFEPPQEPPGEPSPGGESAKGPGAAPALPVIVHLDPRQRLIEDIVGTLMRLAGQTEPEARRTVVGWQSITNGDLALIGAVVAEQAALTPTGIVFAVEERLRRRRVRAHSPPPESTNGRIALAEERHYRHRRALP